MRLLVLSALLLTTCTAKKKTGLVAGNENYFIAVAKNDAVLEEPQPGEWRYAYHETIQSFGDYKKEDPEKAIPGKTKIYLLPLGDFSPEQAAVIDLTREYLQCFFQLETILLKPASDRDIPDTARRVNQQGNSQLYTPYIFNRFLKGKIPQDGYALMAISEKDLYPSPGWNFVFGIASYKDRTGVSSIFRLQEHSSGDQRLFIRRLLNTASHEIGHMFSLHHCLFAKCVMNGSNSLPESDSQPLRLCSDCQQKLQWNIGYNNVKRLKDLIAFVKANKLTKDLLFLEKDQENLQL